MKKRQITPLLGQVLKKIAPRIGATVVIEPEWGIVGQITFRNGRKRYFRYSSLDLNTLGASEIAKDKDYANFFMRRMGYPTVPGKTFFRRARAETIGSRHGQTAAYRYARKIGFPVVVKPNSGSQGVAVALAHTRHELDESLRAIFERDNVALVQRYLKGKDYRVVVLDKKVISAYERMPLSVVGDGTSTIRRLLEKKQRQFVVEGRDTRIRMSDPRIVRVMKEQGLRFGSRPAKGERVYLLHNANLSTGGDSLDVTRAIHPAFKKIAIRLTKDMGLRLCGVDLMVQGDISQKPAVYWVLEVNSAPGLDHYAKTGRTQERTVEKLYLQVLKSMERR